MLVELVKDEVKRLQADKYQHGGSGGQDVHAPTTGQTDGRRHLKTRCSGQVAYHILALLENDGTSTDETDATDDLCRYA